jgi:hypothetical protein
MGKKNYSFINYYNFLRRQNQFGYILIVLIAPFLWIGLTANKPVSHQNNYKAKKASLINSQLLRIPTTCGSVTHLSACATSMVLNAEPNQPNYTWSTGATTSAITVTTSGTYWWETIDMTNNAVDNGSFTGGNNGFTSAYTYVAPNGNTGANGALTREAYYSITTNPRNTHNNFASFTDHTGNATGNMMVVNGAPTTGVTIWAESITVTPNTDYIFSVWFTSVHPDNPGKLNFSINGVPLGTPIELTSGTPDWKNFTVRWNSGTGIAANIGIVNQNTATSGNDFALDDIVFAPVCRNYFDVNLYSNPPKPAISPL